MDAPVPGTRAQHDGGPASGPIPMPLRRLRYLWYTDLYRYGGEASILLAVRHLVVNPGYQYTFWMRLKAYLSTIRPGWAAIPFWVISALMLRRLTIRFGISISAATDIGSGLHIGHIGGIVVNENSVIGKNCNISHDVTLGQANRGRNRGCPRLGDNVYIGPGAKIVGAVRIGNNVAIGANCVVTRDVPDNAVIVGIPGRVISFDGSVDYVNHTDYSPESATQETPALTANAPKQ
jgi:serine O-acetyltransferase